MTIWLHLPAHILAIFPLLGCSSKKYLHFLPFLHATNSVQSTPWFNNP
jgi:hypothetical protein